MNWTELFTPQSLHSAVVQTGKVFSRVRKDPLYREENLLSLQSFLTNTGIRSYRAKTTAPAPSLLLTRSKKCEFILILALDLSLSSCILWRCSVFLSVCCQTDSQLCGVLALRQSQHEEEGLHGWDLGLYPLHRHKK